MPKVDFKLWDLERIAGKSFRIDELTHIVTTLKGEIEEISGDTIVFEASHDRPDLFSVEGLARAVGVFVGSRDLIRYSVEDSGTYLDVSEAPRYRPYAFMAIVENLRLDDEAVSQIFQLQEKLHATYCRDRASVSIGLYDLNKVKPPFRYVAVKNATYVPLGYSHKMSLDEVLKETEKGMTYAHLVKPGEYPIIIDSEDHIFSFPPILNDELSRVTVDTKRVVIDVTGVEPYLMMKVLNVITTSVAERSPKPVIKLVSIKGLEKNGYSKTPDLNGKLVSFKVDDVESLLGFNPLENNGVTLLKKMGYVVKELANDVVTVWVPPFRVDVLNHVDVIEDLAIAYGYNNIIPEILPPTHFGKRYDIERFSDIVREVLVGLGLQEIMNFMLIDPEILKSIVKDKGFVSLANPKMKIYSSVRNSLIPSIMLAVKTNLEKRKNFEIFEIGDIVEIPYEGSVTYVRSLSYALVGENYTLTDALVILKSLMSYLGVSYKLVKGKEEFLIEGRSARIVVNNDVQVGVVGEVKPEVLTSLNIYTPVTVCELNLKKLYDSITASNTPS